MAGWRTSQTNLQLYHKLSDQIGKADDSGKPDDFFMFIGVVTSTFETCEYFLHTVLRPLDKGSKVLPLVFDSINSRSLRAQILGDFLNNAQPKRMTKRYTRIKVAFEEYMELGKCRDEIAHCMITNWVIDGSPKTLLCPPSHIRRKHEGPLPRYHYDIPQLKAVCERLNALHAELVSLATDQAMKNSKQLLQSAKRSQQRSA